MSEARLSVNGPLRESIDRWQPVADQSVHNVVVGEVTISETREVIGRVTWTRAEGRKRVTVDGTVLGQMQQRQGPRVTIRATGEW